MENHKSQIKLNKPIYCGVAVLDLSKICMMDFHYDYIKEKYANKAQLCFTDTDSLFYEIETEDLYEEMWKDKHEFDFSDYPTEGVMSKYQSNDNKKVIGKFKDETLGVPIKEFVGLKAKCYSVLTAGDKQKCTAKGIKQCIKNKELKHEVYKSCLFNERETYHTQRTFKSTKHDVYSIEQYKKSLSCMDNKRFLANDGIHTRAYGHYLNK